MTRIQQKTEKDTAGSPCSRRATVMKHSKTNIAGIAGCLLVAIASAAQANSIVVTQNQYSYGIASEFSAVTSDNFIANYAPVSTLGNAFETFCVESDVLVDPGFSYTYVLANQDSAGRALSLGAAYLYYEFATGQLAGYAYNVPATRQTDAGELQSAIWEFQGGQSLSAFPSYTTDPFYALATNALGSAAFSPSDGAYNVDIVQLWDGTVAGQNQMVYLGAVPDFAPTCGMLALVCGGFVLAGRRFNRREFSAVRIEKKR
jgi:hypothetical protein